MDDLIDPTDPKLFEMADVHTAEVKDGELVFKRENKPMTLDERARKLHRKLFHVDSSVEKQNCKMIVALLREVENEAKAHLEEPFRCPRCFGEGFQAAREQGGGDCLENT